MSEKIKNYEQQLPWVLSPEGRSAVRRVRQTFPEVRYPKKEEDIELGKRLDDQIQNVLPQIQKNIQAAERKRRLEQKQKKAALIEESNTIPGAFSDSLAQLHNMVNARFPNKWNKLVDWELRQTRKAAGIKPRNGWGRFRNQTRDSMQPSIDRGYENMVNRALALAQHEDKRDKTRQDS